MKNIYYLLGLSASLLIPVWLCGALETLGGGDWKDVVLCVSVGWFCGYVYQVGFGDANLRKLERQTKKALQDLGYKDD